MRILILNYFFYPDAAATAQLATDLARALADQGHSVRVICGRSSYAGGDQENLPAPPPVEIVRSAGVPFARTQFARMVSYLSYFCGATLYSLFGPWPDLVLTLTTPPGLSLTGSLLKIVSGARHFIWEMDVYPDVAVDLDVVGARSWLTRVSGLCLDGSRRYADGIIALSKTMSDRLARRGVGPERVHVAENWADGQEIQPRPFPEWRPLRILYSGNLGLPHDVATICAAILHFSSDSRLYFAFAGGGSQHMVVRALCDERGIPNVSFSPYCPRSMLSRSLGSCHIGLVTQKPATIGSIVPSKTYGIMAAGRPMLYIGPKEGTPAKIIQQFGCGWQVDPGDSATLINLLDRLAANPAEIADAGARSREAFVKNYDVGLAVARLCSILGVSQPQAVQSVALTVDKQANPGAAGT